MGRFIDLRSDTVTRPTPEMREIMAKADVGDDVYGEDPTINRLEELAAEMVGMEAALYLPSGTMGNQVAVYAHTQHGDEVILEADSHIFYYEVAGAAVLAGVQTRPVPGIDGAMDPESVNVAIRGENIHFPRTSLVCVENTHNRGGGVVVPLANIRAISDIAHQKGVKVHMDGARVFNAAAALGIDVREVVAPVDSVMFCLSKGLAAPVGSMLAGSSEFIEGARKTRKLFGGGMRQAGIIAAAGVYALEHMVDRLQEDHENARVLAEGLAEVSGIDIDLERVQTNIVAFDTAPPARGLVEGLDKHGVKAGAMGSHRIRMVTHNDIARDDIKAAIAAVAEVMSTLSA